MVTFKINGQVVKAPEGTTILEAAKKMGIEIPTFCYDSRLKPHGTCRICVVEVEKAKSLQAACSTPIAEGMSIWTESEPVVEARKEILNLLLSNHPLDCLTCDKSGNCTLQALCQKYNITGSTHQGQKSRYERDESNPFYYVDLNKCILCRKCVLVCSELQCSDAIGVADRGFASHITPPFEKDIEHSNCVSCGNCVAVCPTGALVPKRKEKFSYGEVQIVQTTCPYCGVGCQMELLVKNNKVVEVRPVFAKPNDGLLCVKGRFGFNFINHPDRLKKPLIKKNGTFVEATWEEAYQIIVDKIKEIKEKYGSDALAGLASARCTNEENYLMQKLFRAVIRTNNIDHCARLCHASTVAGLATTLGSGAMTNSIAEVLDADVIFVTGSNTTETHPVIGAKIRQAIRHNGAKLIVAEPRRIDLAKDADVFLQIKPGTNVALMNGLMSVILEEGLYDEDFIRNRTENFSELKKIITAFSAEKAAEICDVDVQDIRKAARIYAAGEKGAIYYAMGITQHSTGTQHVMSISNLALLCGNIGKEGVGVNPLRGQNNVQGACDMGALPNVYPGYQKVNSPEVQEKFEKAWGFKLSPNAGLTLPEMLEKAENNELKLLYIMGENPLVSDPDINHVRKALENLDFLVVQDIFLTETAQLADVILPAVSFAEKDGTFTNTERRVQLIQKAIKPIGDAKPDWVILMEIMDRLGYKKEYLHPSEIMEEIAAVTPQYGGINYFRIKQEGGLQWPCPTKDHPGTKYLHQGHFTRGKALFMAVDYQQPAENADEDYPLILTTGRILYQYHTRTMTGRVEGLNKKAPESYIEIHPETANKHKIEDGEIIRVISRRGAIFTKARVVDIVNKNIVFMPFHYAEGAANVLTNNTLDENCKIPELKVCAVKIEKIEI
ncbi:MAG: formate dehydrogenase ferredoxin subunit [Clostridia bacterium]|jgi:formate dehydrogenase major subunit|nr:formate dehydrogenase ferredoxin subunit [Clostridia bacterium]MDN5323542.1 formate dehydrogenase ferredoxin subunit [Clostridia bacterium]